MEQHSRLQQRICSLCHRCRHNFGLVGVVVFCVHHYWVWDCEDGEHTSGICCETLRSLPGRHFRDNCYGYIRIIPSTSATIIHGVICDPPFCTVFTLFLKLQMSSLISLKFFLYLLASS
eukprot:PhF_6_TR22267/c0_g1_i1/m.31483